MKWLMTIALFGLGGCAGVDRMVGNKPIIDTKGVDMVAYERDLAECNAYADQVDVARKTASSAAVGAVVGGAVGAAAGNSETAKRGAGVGAATGTLRGVSSSMNERQRVIGKCLLGRGYLVLN